MILCTLATLCHFVLLFSFISYQNYFFNDIFSVHFTNNLHMDLKKSYNKISLSSNFIFHETFKVPSHSTCFWRLICCICDFNITFIEIQWLKIHYSREIKKLTNSCYIEHRIVIQKDSKAKLFHDWLVVCVGAHYKISVYSTNGVRKSEFVQKWDPHLPLNIKLN